MPLSHSSVMQEQNLFLESGGGGNMLFFPFPTGLLLTLKPE